MSSLGLRILCIDDAQDIRESLAELLESEGYEVVTGASVKEALSCLRSGPFHLLITDYSLPDGTAADLLRKARAEALLPSTPAFIITAHPEPTGVDHLKLFRKPLDVDHLLHSMHDILAPVREAELERVRTNVHATPVGEGPLTSARLELILYISAASPSSLRAARNMQRLLAEYEAAQVKYTICDLSKEYAPSVEEDRIAFTPTLVRRAPMPKTWILGDLENIKLVTDLLQHAGVDRKR